MRRQAQKESQHNATEIERWQHNLELAFLSTSRLTTHMSNFVHMTHLGKQITGDKIFLHLQEEPNRSSNFNASFPFLS